MKNKFTGKVIAIIDDKTLKAQVNRYIVNKKYLKQIKRTKKYLVNALTQSFKIDDPINFEQTRSLSKRKSFQAISNSTGKTKDK